VYGNSHMAVAALLACLSAFLELPLSVSGIVSLLWSCPLLMVTDYTQFQRVTAIPAEALQPADMAEGFCNTEQCPASPPRHALYLPRALVFLAVPSVLFCLAHALLNGKRSLDRWQAKVQPVAWGGSKEIKYAEDDSNAANTYHGIVRHRMWRHLTDLTQRSHWMGYWFQPLQLTERQEMWEAQCLLTILGHIRAIKILVPAGCGSVVLYTLAK
jgi:hypothetical protein